MRISHRYIIILIALTICINIITYHTYKKNERLRRNIEALNISENTPITEVLIDNEICDFGNLSTDTIVVKKYTILNVGKNPLLIKEIYPDCHCTKYDISSYKAEPGDSILLNLEVSTKNKPLGEFTINTVVKINAQQPLNIFRLKGNILSGL